MVSLSRELLFAAFASIFFIWAGFGLRGAAAVAVANAVLVGIIASGVESANLLYCLLFGYPLYCGFAFYLLRRLDEDDVPTLPVPLRVGLGFLLSVAFMLAAYWLPLRDLGRRLYATYLISPAERAPYLRELLAQSPPERACDDTYGTLLRLAVTARDREVADVLLPPMMACRDSSAALRAEVVDVVDNGRDEDLRFLIRQGLKPSTPVYGPEYSNGTLLAYTAAVNEKHPVDLLKLIVESDPEDARNLKYAGTLMRTLQDKGDIATMNLLIRYGLKPPADAGR